MNQNYPKFIRRDAVLKIYPVSVSTLYARIKSGVFPTPLSLGGRTVYWIETEVRDCIKKMMDGKDAEQLRSAIKQMIASRKGGWF